MKRSWPDLAPFVLPILFLPLAFLAALLPPNEYRATGISDAIDCDGPFRIYLLGAATLLVYGIALVPNLRRRRRPLNLAALLLCVAVLLAAGYNVGRAAAEDAMSAEACAARG